MFDWLKARMPTHVDAELGANDKFRRLWKELVPLGGESETLQGEIIRSVGRLEDEYNRNGNMNWEPGGYHCEFVEFLKRYLADPTTFDPATVSEIKSAAEQVRLAAEDLETEMIEGEEVQTQKHSADEALMVLTCRAVEWCEKHPDPIYKQPGQDFWIILG
jgi:hypothetical protein